MQIHSRSSFVCLSSSNGLGFALPAYAESPAVAEGTEESSIGPDSRTPKLPNSLILGMEIRAQVTEYVQERIKALRVQERKLVNSKMPHDKSQYNEVSQISSRNINSQKSFLCFPDPFKARKHKARIVSTTLAAECELERLREVLKAESYNHCETFNRAPQKIPPKCCSLTPSPFTDYGPESSRCNISWYRLIFRMGICYQLDPDLALDGYAFVAGLIVPIVGLIALLLLTSRGSRYGEEHIVRRPKGPAFLAVTKWKKELAALRIRKYMNPTFTNEVDKTIRLALVNLRDRLLAIDLVEVVTTRFVPILTAHFKEFYNAEVAIRGKNLNRSVTESDELDLAIAAKYNDGKLHSAASLAFSDTKLILDERVNQLAATGDRGAQVSQSDRNGAQASKLENASLVDLLHDPSGLSYFMEYMDRQNCMSLVQFWIVVDGFRNPLEDDVAEDEEVPTTIAPWTDADRTDLAQINDAYLSKPELKVPDASKRLVQDFLKAGSKATSQQYFMARRAILRAQTSALEEASKVRATFPSTIA
ncbi:hypothetical protein DID88_010388 [Monilinia fructigena]|uniref:tRNA (guanine(46)-N(7))-methyltransferase n=1 Tax=Monilinia fructigena TaxID=38457 RepID=A0A395IFF3_9HELO|nr:hypothetical protein DID88_010388 [Monilinia fructigena]